MMGNDLDIAARATPRQNQLLAALPAEEYRRIEPHLKWLSLASGEVIVESGAEQTGVIFPCSGVVSLIYPTECGMSVEVALTGSEGIVGIQPFMGATSTPGRTVARSDFEGYRLRTDLLQKELAAGGELMTLALRYIQALLTQMAQTAVCSRLHSLSQQLCRLLLLTLDRLPSADLAMTHESIANMLGVRREGITEAAGKLQRTGVIRCRRGHIVVVDRAALEGLACECYAVVRNEYDRLSLLGSKARGPGKHS